MSGAEYRNDEFQDICNRPSHSSFHFTVTDSFLIEGRGLIIAPFFPVDEFRFDVTERVCVQRPDGTSYEGLVNFEVPMLSPMPKVLLAMGVLRGGKKEEVPLGSVIVLLDKTNAQVHVPHSKQ
jgi:hypothetical protein